MRAVLVALAGVVAFAAAALYLAPAALVAGAVPAPVRLWQVEGTLWRGAGRLAYGGWELGRLTWRFDPAALAAGAVGLRFGLGDGAWTLAGTVRADLADVAVAATGVVREAAIDQALAPYHIDLDGAIAIDRLDIRARRGMWAVDGAGAASWAGGAVSYRLAGRRHAATLPPMRADVALQPGAGRLVAKAREDPTPLIIVRLDAEGWVHIAITQRFTELAGLPWPGARAPDAVVIEVSESLFQALPGGAPDPGPGAAPAGGQRAAKARRPVVG